MYMAPATVRFPNASIQPCSIACRSVRRLHLCGRGLHGGERRFGAFDFVRRCIVTIPLRFTLFHASIRAVSGGQL